MCLSHGQVSDDGFESRRGTIAVLNVSTVNDEPHHQTERDGDDVALAAFDFLARVIARNRTGSQTGSSTSSLIAAMPGASSKASRGASCPSDTEDGRMSYD
jgi:hypothetical protein